MRRFYAYICHGFKLFDWWDWSVQVRLTYDNRSATLYDCNSIIQIINRKFLLDIIIRWCAHCCGISHSMLSAEIRNYSHLFAVPLSEAIHLAFDCHRHLNGASSILAIQITNSTAKRQVSIKLKEENLFNYENEWPMVFVSSEFTFSINFSLFRICYQFDNEWMKLFLRFTWHTFQAIKSTSNLVRVGHFNHFAPHWMRLQTPINILFYFN